MDEREWMLLFNAYKQGKIVLQAAPNRPLDWEEVWTIERIGLPDGPSILEHPHTTTRMFYDGEKWSMLDEPLPLEPQRQGDVVVLGSWQTDRDVSAYYDKLWLNELGITGSR